MPSSDFWANLSTPNIDSKQVPWKTQRDIVQAFLLMKRSEEEKKLLEADMHTTVTYWSKRTTCISKAIVELGSMVDDQFSRGAICSLKQLKWEAELHQARAITVFGDLIELPTADSQTYRNPLSYSDDESSDSNTESDSDDDYGDDLM